VKARLSLQAVANGDVSSALSVASIFAQTFADPVPDAQICAPDSPSAAARERILATMLQLDSVTYGSSTYILQVTNSPIPYFFTHTLSFGVLQLMRVQEITYYLFFYFHPMNIRKEIERRAGTDGGGAVKRLDGEHRG